MPAKDLYHETVKNALLQDGWTITHDPLVLKWGRRDLYVDFGAERLLAAEKGERRIAVEVKSFLGPSDVDDLEKALGQFILYHDVLAESDPARELFLAIPSMTLHDIFEDALGQLLLKNERIRLIVFDAAQERIVQWIP